MCSSDLASLLHRRGRDVVHVDDRGIYFPETGEVDFPVLEDLNGTCVVKGGKFYFNLVTGSPGFHRKEFSDLFGTPTSVASPERLVSSPWGTFKASVCTVSGEDRSVVVGLDTSSGWVQVGFCGFGEWDKFRPRGQFIQETASVWCGELVLATETGGETAYVRFCALTGSVTVSVHISGSETPLYRSGGTTATTTLALLRNLPTLDE